MTTTPRDAVQHELERLSALRDLRMLDTPHEPRFDRVVRLAQKLFDVPIVAVTLIDADRQWHKANVGLGDFVEGPRGNIFCTYTIAQPGPFVVADASEDVRFFDNAEVSGAPGIRFYAGQPLEAPGGQRVGSLCIFDTKPRIISPGELDLLRDMADWVEKELASDEELHRATIVQQLLLPAVAPDIPGYRISGRSKPARDVGGDFFDYHLVDGQNLQLAIADVMGKGLPAALVAATARGVLRGATLFSPLVEAVNRVSISLEDDLSRTSTFVTLFAARLQPASGTLSYVDAGHSLSAIVTAGGRVRLLESEEPPLGVQPELSYTGHSDVLNPGDTFITVSDGLLDFFDTAQAMVSAVVDAVATTTTADDLVAHVLAFSKGRPPSDDLTVLVVRRDV